MKKFLAGYAAIAYLILLLGPFAASIGQKPKESVQSRSAPTAVSSAIKQASPSPSAPNKTEPVFHIYDTSTDQILTVPDKEFLYGAIVTEMSLYCPDEALKAQAVAAYTYYSRLRAQNTDPTAADFSCSTKEWLSYTTRADMEERWADSFSTYYTHLQAIVDAVYGEALFYDGELACTTYFALSSGNTENAEDVWGSDIPYLRAVASPGDRYADGYQTAVTLSSAELQKQAHAYWGDGLSFSGSAQSWLQVQLRSASGGVKSAVLGQKEVTGGEIRSAFGLRSAVFDVVYDETDDTFTFTVRGWGHGVGMSQTGAAYMAQDGADYRSILSWYYPGTELQQTEKIAATS